MSRKLRRSSGPGTTPPQSWLLTPSSCNQPPPMHIKAHESLSTSHYGMMLHALANHLMSIGLRKRYCLRDTAFVKAFVKTYCRPKYRVVGIVQRPWWPLCISTLCKGSSGRFSEQVASFHPPQAWSTNLHHSHIQNCRNYISNLLKD